MKNVNYILENVPPNYNVPWFGGNIIQNVGTLYQPFYWNCKFKAQGSIYQGTSWRISWKIAVTIIIYYIHHGNMKEGLKSIDI